MRDENDEGREIVLGNKQLLSMFFIVAALLGVAFTMGYIIGRNTTGVSAASNTTTTVAPPTVNNTAPADAPETESTPAPVARTESNPPTPVSGTQPAKPYRGNTAPQPVAPPAPDETTPGSSPKVPAGSYLQIAALKRQDADHLVDVLTKRGYPALLGESPKEGLFRVLVGPFKDMSALADSKQRLKAAGIDSIVAR
jgi:cell division septation protein DedD